MRKLERRVDPADFIIVTGLSGSGMSSATNAFEDLGYFCVDNLPLTMLSTFARLLEPGDEGVPAIKRAALVINIREGHFLDNLQAELGKLEKQGIKPFVIFFEASGEVLQRRFSETRRPHPTRSGKSLASSIRDERHAMEPVREFADMIVDTSEHTVHTLRRFLVQRFSPEADGTPLRVQVVSFGHKYGGPRDLELMFDVRHLPNPYFDDTLKHFTGRDSKVIDFLDGFPEVKETIDRFNNLLAYLLPLYKQEGKSYLTIGIGCTGGKHRSVMVASRVGEFLKNRGFDVSVSHRDVQK